MVKIIKTADHPFLQELYGQPNCVANTDKYVDDLELLKEFIEKEKINNKEKEFPQNIFLSSFVNSRKENVLHIYPDLDFLFITHVGTNYGRLSSYIRNQAKPDSSKHFQISNLLLVRLWTELTKLKELLKKETITICEYQNRTKKLLTDNIISPSENE